MKRRIFVGAGAAALAAAPVWAQSKIGGDVRFYCGFAPGGTADLLCRILADAVTSEVGQKVIVDTKTGASGFIANETVANAAPDGRTIGLAAMAAMCVAPVMPGQKLPINVDTDLTPIANIAGVYNMLVFGKHVAFRTVPELIEQAKKNPGKLSYASAGNGTSQHLAGELFQKMAGVKLLHVPYRGGAPAIQDMVAGNCDMMFGNMPEFLGQIGGGGLIPIAFGSPHASPLFPNLPVISQLPAGLRGGELVRRVRLEGPAGRPGRHLEQGAARRRRQARRAEALRRERHGHGDRLARGAQGHHHRRPQEVGRGDQGGRHPRGLGFQADRGPPGPLMRLRGGDGSSERMAFPRLPAALRFA